MTLFRALLLFTIICFTGADVIEVQGCSDLSVAGGASVLSNPIRNIRSGEPGQKSTATITSQFASGVVLQSMSFAYQYLTGYSPSSNISDSSNFTVSVFGKQIYQSPHLYNYSYDHNKSGYSPPVPVLVKSLDLSVPVNGAQIEFFFQNNARNVQIMLPLEVSLTCVDKAGASVSCLHAGYTPPTPTTVFNGGESLADGRQCACFRIPAIVRLGNGSLLAVAEGRCTSCWPDVRKENRVVVRTSYDTEGKLWSPIRVIDQNGSDYQNYPTPIVDRKTGMVHLFYVAGNCMWGTNSSDGGLTWALPAQNMTARLGWATSMAGGGGGVQLQDGRLVFPCSSPQPNPGRTACYSDDHGVTWHHGSVIPNGPKVTGLGEASIIQDRRTPNSMAMFIRVGSTLSSLTTHALAISNDGGETFGPALLLPDLIGPTCQGSIGQDPTGPPGSVLLSAPFSRDGSLNGRENLSIWSVQIAMDRTVNDTTPFETELVGGLWKCKGAYSGFIEAGDLNLFEGGVDMRYERIMLAHINDTHN
eukprot:m.157470 g.157470  ORF g.157470 m.157470 type:complete len:530 (+) comp15118_c0_seq7:815-2404(+)